jgi:plastocyanin
MKQRQLRIATIVSASMICLPPVTAWAAGDGGGPAGAPTAADVAKLQAEVDRLKQEVREQRQLILQLMQAEQQRYDIVLKYLQSGSHTFGSDGSALPPLPSPTATVPKPAGAAEAAKEGASAGPPGARESATVTGRVRTSGQSLGEAYVYLDGPRGSPARGHTVEIKQKDKQFSPRVAVVPLGTRVVFPNQDTVIHNVFSTAAGNSFDLGSIKGGETSSPVTLLKPGPVEVFCNIHAKMRSDILVVPNSHWTRVGADGSFSISGVPVGTRKLVLWSPAAKPISQQVEVTAKGGTVTFSAESSAIRPHLNKRGAAYGSYDE